MRSLPVLLLLAFAGCGSAAPDAQRATRPATAKLAAAKPAANPGVEGEALVSFDTLAAVLPGVRTDDWYGIYAGDSKVGYMQYLLRPSADGEPGGFVAQNKMWVFRQGAAGAGEQMKRSITSYYAGAAPYRLLETRKWTKSRDASERQRVVFSRDATTLHLQLDGVAKKPRVLPASRQTIASLADSLAIGIDSLTPGQKAVYLVFDHDKEKDTRSTLTVLSIESRIIAGVRTRVVTYTQKDADKPGTERRTVAEGGMTLHASFGNMRMLRETEPVAKSNVQAVDLLNDSVPVDTKIGDPRTLTSLSLRLRGVSDEARLPSAPNQRVSTHADGTVRLELRTGRGARAGKDEVSLALRANSTVDHQTPAIGARAKQLTMGVDSRPAKVERLRRWVYDTLEKKLSMIGAASQVLERRRGDCTEHAVLFAALARSVGIPAREVDGLIYMGDELQRFGWHTWNEVEIDGYWWPVDASWPSQVANVSHIKTGETPSSNNLAILIGAIKIELIGRPATP